MSPSLLRTTLVVTAAVVTLSTAGCRVVAAPVPGPSSTHGGTGTVGSSSGTDVDGLVVAAPHAMTGYSRDRFPHWVDQGGGCDTRDVVLKRDGKNVVSTATCKITAGSWVSSYDEKTFTDPQQLDIDHLVPLADAWRSGADTWTDQKRSQFANDLVRPQLIAVSATANRAKGDQDPSQWRPPNHAYWCEYAQRWVAVKRYWQLTVTEKEKSKLVEMLGTCK